MAKRVSTAVKQEEQLGDLEIPLMALQTIEVTVAGDGDGVVLQNKITQREKDTILGVTVGGQKDPIANSKRMREEGGWKERGHYSTSGKLGHPAEGFMRCMGAAVGSNYSTSKGVKLKWAIELNRSLTVEGDEPGADGEGMLVLFTKGDLAMHTHWAQLQGKTPVPLYRPGISNWEAVVRISYNPTVFTSKDVLTLLAQAGRMIGIGAYRKEKRGPYGAFKLVTAKLVAK